MTEPEPAVMWNREAAYRAVWSVAALDTDPVDVEVVLDALEACVRPAPVQTVNRDALAWAISDVLMRVYDNGTSPNARREAEEVVLVVLALLRPVDGVTLTREEAWVAAEALMAWNAAGHIISRGFEIVPFAARLEAAS